MNKPNGGNGFSTVELCIILVVLAILGLGGWYVWQRNRTHALKTTNTAASNAKTTEGQEKYVVPDNYTIYENADLGFKFAYPKEWGELQATQDKTVFLSTQTANIPGDTSTIHGTLKVWMADAGSFRLRTGYSTEIKPVQTHEGYAWIVAAVDPDFDGQSVGSSYKPAPSEVFKQDSVHVYELETGHASNAWSVLAFPVGDRFVGVQLPSNESTGMLADGTITANPITSDQYQDLAVKIAKTVRIM